jgi:hypothetical protein
VRRTLSSLETSVKLDFSSAPGPSWRRTRFQSIPGRSEPGDSFESRRPSWSNRKPRSAATAPVAVAGGTVPLPSETRYLSTALTKSARADAWARDRSENFASSTGFAERKLSSLPPLELDAPIVLASSPKASTDLLEDGLDPVPESSTEPVAPGVRRCEDVSLEGDTLDLLPRTVPCAAGELEHVPIYPNPVVTARSGSLNRPRAALDQLCEGRLHEPQATREREPRGHHTKGARFRCKRLVRRRSCRR